MTLSFHVHDKDANYIVELWDISNRKFAAIENEPGSGEFTIHADSVQATTTNLKIGNLIRVDWQSTAIGWWIIEDMDEKLVTPNRADEEIVVRGRGLLALLQKALIYPLLWPAESTKLDAALPFAPSVGYGFFSVLNSNTEWPFYISFYATIDSDGLDWDSNVYMEFRPGQNMLDVVNAIAGLGYYVRVNPSLYLEIFSTYGNGIYGNNKTSTVYFRKGLNIVAASRKTPGSDLANVVLTKGQLHWVEASDNTSITAHNRRQMFLQASNAGAENQAIAAGESLLDRTAEPTFDLSLEVSNTPTAFVDYNVGDLVNVIIPGKVDADYRVKSITLTQRTRPDDLSVTLGINREAILPANRFQYTVNAGTNTASAPATNIQAPDTRDGVGAPIQYRWFINGTLTTGDAQGGLYKVQYRTRIEEFGAIVATAPGSVATFDIDYSVDAGASWASIFSLKPTIPASQVQSTGGIFAVRSLNANTLLRFNIDGVGAGPAAASVTAILAGTKI